MMIAKLEDVFKKAGVPTYTFVAPREYTKILVALRTAGRALISRAPLASVKSRVKKAIGDLGATFKCIFLSARKPADIAQIRKIPTSDLKGFVVVDDFHRLDAKARRALTDYVKTLADDELEDPKIVRIGTNSAGQSMI